MPKIRRMVLEIKQGSQLTGTSRGEDQKHNVPVRLFLSCPIKILNIEQKVEVI